MRSHRVRHSSHSPPQPWQAAKPTRRGDPGKRKQDTVAAAAQNALIMRHQKIGQNTAHESNRNTPGMQAGTVPAADGASPSQFAREISSWRCKKSTIGIVAPEPKPNLKVFFLDFSSRDSSRDFDPETRPLRIVAPAPAKVDLRG